MGAEAERRGLKGRSIPDLESEFKEEPDLGMAPRAGEYLSGQVAMSGVRVGGGHRKKFVGANRPHWLGSSGTTHAWSIQRLDRLSQ